MVGTTPTANAARSGNPGRDGLPHVGGKSWGLFLEADTVGCGLSAVQAARSSSAKAAGSDGSGPRRRVNRRIVSGSTLHIYL